VIRIVGGVCVFDGPAHLPLSGERESAELVQLADVVADARDGLVQLSSQLGGGRFAVG
jgi:hypothetical protein